MDYKYEKCHPSSTIPSLITDCYIEYIKYLNFLNVNTNSCVVHSNKANPI